MRVVVLALLVGCGFEHGLAPGTDGNGTATDDGGPDSGDAPACGAWAQPPTSIDPCTTPAPESALRLCEPGQPIYSSTIGAFVFGSSESPASTLDTNSNPDRRIVSVMGLEICAGTSLRIVGNVPIVFVVHGEVLVDGSIDASAWIDPSDNWQPGPGGDVACTAGNGATAATNSGGAGGGGGGGFGAMGGAGGPSETNVFAAGGTPEGNAALETLRGGCHGGNGGNGDNADTGGRAGRGGGAVQIAARDGVIVNGQLRANGGPGLGGSGTDGGGGGGGAGGAILVEGASVSIGQNAVLCANGGGGGGGANDGGPFNRGGSGDPGPCAAIAAPAGPGGANNGQPGGKGGFGTTAAEPGKGADEGGGGGGGAVGRIRVRSPSMNVAGTLTPPAA